MAALIRSSSDSSRLQKSSGVISWLKVGLAAAGAVGGAGVIAITLHLVTSRSDELPSAADWRQAVVAAVVSVRTWSAATASQTEKDQQSPQDGHPTISAVNSAQASTEAAAKSSEETDAQYTPTHLAVTPATTVVNEAVQRGEAMVSLGDYAAARLLYRFAAERGSADAALKLAKTYDADPLPNRLSLRPDEAEAARWYRAANELRPGIQAEQSNKEAE